MVTLYATSTAPDTDFFVQLLDVDPEENESYLQRGLLRASFRAVDGSRADRIQGSGPLADQVYRPYHPFTNATLLTPGEVNEYQIEVFPLGHVFRGGHRLVVRIYSPPAADELYIYGSGQAPALNTIVEDTDHPSNILLPFMPALPPISASAPACGAQTGVRCVKPLAP
jgi:predicted acyl esterase